MSRLVDIERKVTLLHVEDDDGDAFLTQRAFREMSSSIDLVRVTGGQDALQFIKRKGPYGDAPRTGCVLLDLNMANGDGLWLLDRMKELDASQQVPTVVLSGAPDCVAETRGYRFVSCAIVKPDNQAAFERLMAAVRRVTAMTIGIAA
ncbi:response regulator [Hyphobacterium sp.]|uniref:response regulator n=1 Tax=Hyphobacterium sp. TaxID=2004662 RepID=UPI003BAD3770